MSNETIQIALNDISKNYHDFMEKANMTASSMLLDKEVEYRFYERNQEESIDFDNPKVSFGKIKSLVVTSDNDILFDILDEETEELRVMFSRDIISVKE